MPFVSKAQRRACYAANDPNWDCGAWEAHTKNKNLPERKKKFSEWLTERELNALLPHNQEDKHDTH